MKTKLVALFSLNLAEAHYAHQVLCTTQVELSENATALHDALADALTALDNVGTRIIEADVAIEITLSQPLLEEIRPIFGRRSPLLDEREGLDPIDGSSIAEGFIDALAALNRTTADVTSQEIGGIIAAQKPAAPRATGLNRIAKFFGNN